MVSRKTVSITDVQNLLTQGLSTRQISSRLSTSQSTVQRIRNQLKDLPATHLKGRPRKLTPQDERTLIRYVSRGDVSSTSEASHLLREDTGVTVSKWTVQRSLHRSQFRAIEKKKKPLLSKKNIKARLAYYSAHKDWTEDDWKKVIWSDESKINRYSTDGRSWSWKREGESLKPRDFIQTVKHGGGNIKVWGCVTAFGVGPIHKITGNMNKEMYLDILKNHLIETVENMPYPEKEVIFQHDNDPKHTAKLVKKPRI